MSLSRILFLADSHLGFDTPVHPRIKRRRRGEDFFANYRRALDAARLEEIDLVIHGGDMFSHTKVPPRVIMDAFEPLIELADDGVPVFIVPGNHERSKIPQTLFTMHKNLHVFSEPLTYDLSIDDIRISLSGFPYTRNIRDSFPRIVSSLAQGISSTSDVRILCMHHVVEGAVVGVFDYTFKNGEEVIRGSDLTGDFDVILSGHIHRYQILTDDLDGQPLGSHVYYPGSIERTTYAERNEVKGYLILEIKKESTSKRPVLSHQFIPLPTRPMVSFDITGSSLTVKNIAGRISGLFENLDPDSVVRIAIRGEIDTKAAQILTNEYLRSLAPDTMNVTLIIPGRQPHSDGTL